MYVNFFHNNGKIRLIRNFRILVSALGIHSARGAEASGALSE